MLAPNEVLSEYARTIVRVKARQLARRPGFSRSDRDDLEQDLRLLLLTQLKHFDPNRGSFNTFVARVVTSGVAMILRDRERQKRKPASDAIIQSLEVMVDQPDGPPLPLWQVVAPGDLDRRIGGETPLEDVAREQADAVAHAMRTLSPQLGEICRRLMAGDRATARDLGLSRRKFTAAMIAIRRHFERAGLANA